MTELPEQEVSRVLQELLNTTEGLMVAGLTSSSRSIQEVFQRAFEQAAKHRLLRLSSNLRIVGEELKRFFEDDASFSERRLATFLNRSWLLSQNYMASVGRGDESAISRLKGIQTSRQVDKLRLAAVGVLKKSVPGVFSALQFHVRDLDCYHEKPLNWSCVAAALPGKRLSPEMLLWMEQTQKFRPEAWLNSVLCIDQAYLVEDEFSIRVQLPKEATVSLDEAAFRQFSEQFEQQHQWSPRHALERLEKLQTSPLDLETQPQEEVYLCNWQLGLESHHPALPGKVLFPLQLQECLIYAIVDEGEDGQELLTFFRDKKNLEQAPCPLFGLMHYEQGLCVVQVLSAWLESGELTHLMLGQDRTDYKSLLKSL